MEREFWLERWRNGQTGFHLSAPNPALMRNFSRLALAPGSRVLVPLCGKSVDLHWLLENGISVVGVELSRDAVEALFVESLQIVPKNHEEGAFERFSAPGIDVLVGDIFDLTSENLGKIDAIYDRAALVALPADMRARYARHLTEVTGTARQLLVSFDYDQSAMDGPPFSVSEPELQGLYGGDYRLTKVDSSPDHVRDMPVMEDVYLLQPN